MKLEESTPAKVQAPDRGPQRAAATEPAERRPRLGFLGTGWIGRNRMEALARSGLVEVAAIAEPSWEAAAKAALSVPGAKLVRSLEDLASCELEGVVIATPSALHMEQTLKALEAGLAVFCQKPLGRTAEEAAQAVATARRTGRLLGVDLSYRFIKGIRLIHELCTQGALGEIYAADLVFHNAYGPDKPWFYDPALSGGGCVMDLGIHLVDLALWMFSFPPVVKASSRLFSKGKPLRGRADTVEDYAEARLDLRSGATVRLACSWGLPAGCDAVIRGAFYGTRGGAAFHNLGGSFYEFQAVRFNGTKRDVLAEGPEEWGGRAAVAWAERLAGGGGFDPETEHLVAVAQALDAIYENSER